MIGRNPMPPTSSFDFPASLRTWTEVTRDVAIPLGPPEAELIQRAELISRRLDDEPIHRIAEELSADSDVVELMHALRQVLEHVGDSPAENPYSLVCRAYELASLLIWDDDIDEGAEIRGQFALIAWRHCRRFRSFREMKDWERRCVAHVEAQSHIQDFLSLPLVEVSDVLA